MVSAEDYWWMIELCAPKAIAVTKGSGTDTCRTRGFSTGKLLLIPPYDEFYDDDHEDYIVSDELQIEYYE